VRSPAEFVGETLTKAGPVLAIGLSRQQVLGASRKFVTPRGAGRLEVVGRWFVEAGQQLRGKITSTPTSATALGGDILQS
jgi:hypothetical protein